MVFTGIFALALLKINPRSRKPLVEFFAAVKDALFVVIAWVMALSPYGIFALVLPVAANLGTESVVLLGSFILLTCSLIVLLAGTLYLILGLLGYDVWRFARTMAPVQVIGLGTRSSSRRCRQLWLRAGIWRSTRTRQAWCCRPRSLCSNLLLLWPAPVAPISLRHCTASSLRCQKRLLSHSLSGC